MTIGKLGCGIGRTITAVTVAFLLSGCKNFQVDHSPATKAEAAAIKEAMRRKDEIIFFSSPELDSSKPVLLLLHGASNDPLEMMNIVLEWRGKYNVLLYAYNFHKPIETVAADLVCEMKKLRAKMEAQNAKHAPMAGVTVVTYSYSAAVFRKAVLMAYASTLFSEVSLIQLVPTSGGSYLARGMKYPIVEFLVSLASSSCTVENPYGSIAAELWGEEGNRRFYEVINPRLMHTILVEGDPHSLANIQDKEIQRRYYNGIGINVVVIPKSIGATHDYFTIEPVALGYLRTILKATSDDIPVCDHQAILNARSTVDR